MPTQITAHAVSKSFGGKPVLEAVTCSLLAGERTGIVGENGSGKTTLLRLFAGCERPDEGEIVVHAEGGIGYLAQDERLPAETDRPAGHRPVPGRSARHRATHAPAGGRHG